MAAGASRLFDVLFLFVASGFSLHRTMLVIQVNEVMHQLGFCARSQRLGGGGGYLFI